MTPVKTESGTLLDGVPFAGVLHVDFEISLPVMHVTGQALDDTEDKFGTVDGYAADTFYRTAVLAGALVRLGDIPREALTAALLYDNLTEDDYDRLRGAVAALKGKRNGGSPASPVSGSSPSPSDAAASPKSK